MVAFQTGLVVRKQRTGGTVFIHSSDMRSLTANDDEDGLYSTHLWFI